ncbi:UBX domain-containing protein 11-like [Planoprotostelium fungivorum]|uniref:UBX domain-containing protein 11-like n=1 Tax=Planoprotostelium fungivorum TaxID=1890364 RepID=A0A2P6NFA0_9EUKA|nr:UBX domain-containing protein 11-like [Planoprotostelium fungivorum]
MLTAQTNIRIATSRYISGRSEIEGKRLWVPPRHWDSDYTAYLGNIALLMIQHEDLGSRLEKRLLSDLRRSLPQSDVSSQPTQSAVQTYPRVSDSSFLSSLTARVTKLEEQNRKQTQLLADKELELLTLRRKQSNSSNASQLQEENRHLREELKQMKKFLDDYGLEWVGSQSDRNSLDDEDDTPTNTTQKPTDEPDRWGWDRTLTGRDWKDLLASVAELNAIAGEGKTLVQTTPRKSQARLVKVDPLKITIFTDGFLLGKLSSFRSFHHEANRLFIRDLLDGYFPYELKDTYPDGIPFDVVDHHLVTYQSHVTSQSPSPTNRRPMAGVGQPTPTTVGREQFLEKLPKVVISANGNVIDMRNSFAGRLGGKRGEEVKKEIDTGVEGREGVTSLRVRLDDETTVSIKLRYGDTIKTLRSHLDPLLKGARKEYELRTTLQTAGFTDLDQTLEAAGLVPNAVVYIRRGSIKPS